LEGQEYKTAFDLQSPFLRSFFSFFLGKVAASRSLCRLLKILPPNLTQLLPEKKTIKM